METISESSGNVFADLGFSSEESALLAMRAELMARLRETIAERGWTQTEAASQFGIGHPVSLTWCVASGRYSASTCW